VPEAQTRLRLNIDGNWTAAEMSASFAAINDLYALRQALEIVRHDADEMRLFFERYYFGPRYVPPGIFRRMGHLAGMPAVSQLLQTPDDLMSILEPGERLQVRTIRYGSEGFKDFWGVGASVGHLKELIVKLIDVGAGRKRRKLEEEGIEIDNEAKRLKNAREYIQIAKELGYTEPELRQMITWTDKRQIVLIDLARQQKLIGVDKPSSKDNSNDAR
jgi:hypothetical protein